MTTLPYEQADLKNRSTIEAIVKVYQVEVSNIRRAYETLGRAGENLTAAFGKESSYSELKALPRQCYNWESALNEVLLELKSSCWRHLVERLGIRKVLSLKRNEELSKKLDNKKELPDITVQAVFETFDLLVGSANDFAREAVKEVYEALHVRRLHRDSSHWEQTHTLKTNQRNATEDLGKKIILTGNVRPEWGGTGYRVEYGRTSDKLTALDKVFHALDGQPFNLKGYISPLIDAIHTSGPEGSGETDYFKFKCYGNGNLHIEFKRLDLLKEFNRIANDGTQLKSGEIF